MELSGFEDIYAQFREPQAPPLLGKQPLGARTDASGRRPNSGSNLRRRHQGCASEQPINRKSDVSGHKKPAPGSAIGTPEGAAVSDSASPTRKRGKQKDDEQTGTSACQPVLLELATTASPSTLDGNTSTRRSFEDIVGVEELEKLMRCFAASSEECISQADGSEQKRSLYQLTDPHVPPPSRKGDFSHRSLNEEEFVAAVHSVLPSQTQEEIRGWFRRIDADGSSEVDWEQLSTFLLSHGRQQAEAEGRAAEYDRVASPSSCPPSSQHEQQITAVLIHPKTGSVYTGSRDGALRMWEGSSLRHVKLFYNGNSWITGMRFSRGEARIFVCTAERSLHVFDARSCEMIRTYLGREIIEDENGLNYAVGSIPVVSVGKTLEGYMAPKKMRAHARGITATRPSTTTCGTRSVSFGEYKAMMEERRVKRAEKKQLEQYTLAGMTDTPMCMEYVGCNGEDMIILGMRTGHIRVYKIPTTLVRIVRTECTIHLHTASLNSMQRVESSNTLLTCADDGLIKLTNLTTLQVIKTYQSQAFRAEISSHLLTPLVIGVHALAVAPLAKLFVSCARDRQPLVWDFLQEAPIFRLEEHPAPLLGCAINEEGGHIVTASVDSCIKIFDMRSYRCIQVIQERHRARECAISFIVFDARHHRIVTGATWPSKYAMHQRATRFPVHYCGHTTSISAMLFNGSNESLVSFDNEFVKVWKCGTGDLQFQFSLQSFTDVHGERRLTVASFDALSRRVLTGFHEGTVVVWNPHNGQALSILKDPTFSGEVTAAFTIQRKGQCFHIAAAGRRLLIAKEVQQFTVLGSTQWAVPEILGAISCATAVDEQLLACGTDTGAVFFFHIVNEQIDGSVLTVANGYELSQQSRSSRSVTHTHSTETTSSAKCTGEFEGEHMSSVFGRSSRADALWRIGALCVVAVFHSDGYVRFWHTVKRKHCGDLLFAHHTNSVVSAVTLDDTAGEYLVHSDDLAHVFVWQLNARKVHEMGSTASSQGSNPACCIADAAIIGRFQAHTAGVNALAIVREGSPFIAVGCADGVAKLFTPVGACVGQFGLDSWNLRDVATWVRIQSEPIPPVDAKQNVVEDPHNHDFIVNLFDQQWHSELSEVTKSAVSDTPWGLMPAASRKANYPTESAVAPQDAPPHSVKRVTVSRRAPGGRMGKRSANGVLKAPFQRSMAPVMQSSLEECSAQVIPSTSRSTDPPQHVEPSASDNGHSNQLLHPDQEATSHTLPREEQPARECCSSVRPMPGGKDEVRSALDYSSTSVWESSFVREYLEEEERKLRSNRKELVTHDMARVMAQLDAKTRKHEQRRLRSDACALPTLATPRSRPSVSTVKLITSPSSAERIGGLENWTERVASLIGTCELDEIAPPRGSRAHEEEQRRGFRRHNIFSKKGKNTQTGQQAPSTARF